MPESTKVPVISPELQAELQIPQADLAQIIPMNNLSILDNKKSEGKLFTFIKPVVNTRFMSDTDKLRWAQYETRAQEIKDGVAEADRAETIELDAKPISTLERVQATTYMYLGNGLTIGMRASSLINLRRFDAKDVTATATAKIKAAITKEAFTTIGTLMLKSKEESDKTSAPGASKVIPIFPASFQVVKADPIVFDGVEQTMLNGEAGKEDAKSYPMQAYELFDDEVQKRKDEIEAANMDVEDKNDHASFNISDIYNDSDFRFSLRGTKLKKDGEGYEAYKSIYIAAV